MKISSRFIDKPLSGLILQINEKKGKVKDILGIPSGSFLL